MSGGHTTPTAPVTDAGLRLVLGAFDIPPAGDDGRPLADGAALVPLVEAAPDFLARARTLVPAVPLVEGFVPGDGICLLHAQPRVLKTWIAEEVSVCVATGASVFGLLRVPQAGPVLYVTNEDGAKRTADRIEWLLAGHGITTSPADLHFLVHKGASLDDPEWQSRLIDVVKTRGVRLVVLDPLRSVTACVDKGPSDLHPFATYLRLLIRKTGCAVLASHHDSKPSIGVRDDRKRPHRASGGGLFSIADAPIHLERLGDSPTVIATPCGWKFSDDPPPLEITLEVTGNRARLTATVTPLGDAETRVLDAALLKVLADSPGLSGSHVAVAVRGNKQRVLDALHRLSDAGQVDSARRGRAIRWFLTPTPAARGSVVPHGSRTIDRSLGSMVLAPIGGRNHDQNHTAPAAERAAQGQPSMAEERGREQ